MAYTPTTWVEGVTKVGPTNLNHLEAGVQATAVVSDAAIPKPVAPATSAGLVYNGSAWVAALLVNGNIDPAANIAYSKLTLAGSIVNTDVASGAAIAYSKLSLTGGILNADVNAAAAIDGTKLGVNTVRSLYRKTTAKVVANTVADTDLLNAEITVAANILGATGGLRLTAVGDWINNTGSPAAHPRFKLKFGASTVLDTAAMGAVMSASASRFGWKIVCEICNSATNVQWSNMRVDGTSANGVGAGAVNFATGAGLYGAYVTSGGFGHVIAEGGAASALDTTSAQTLVLSVINGAASASYDTTLKFATVEII